LDKPLQRRACPICPADEERAPPRSRAPPIPGQAYDIKSVADYGVGPEIDVPLDRAATAIDTAEQFVDQIAELLT